MLQACGLTKRFGPRIVLEDVDLAVHEGETVVIIGASGSGKTTLLRCLNRLETPEAGLVRIGDVTLGQRTDGRPADEAELARQRRLFGFVFQRFNLFPHLTAMENVALGPRRVLGMMRALTPYSCSSRCATTSNCNCPTAPSSSREPAIGLNT